jgi:hypothetical protein
LYQFLVPGIEGVLQQHSWQDTPTSAAAAAAEGSRGGGGKTGRRVVVGGGSAGGSHMSDLARLRRLLRKGASAAVWTAVWQQYAAAQGDGAGVSLLTWADSAAAAAAAAAGSDIMHRCIDASLPYGGGAVGVDTAMGDMQPAAAEEGVVEVSGGGGARLVHLAVGRLREALLEGGRV